MFLALALLKEFAFSGGGLTKLADELSHAAKRPVVFLTSSDTSLPAFKVGYLDEKHFVSRIASKTELYSYRNTIFAFGPEAWPDDAVANRNRIGLPATNIDLKLGEWPKKADASGTITIRADGKYLSMGTLEFGPWKDDVSVPKFYAKMKVVVSAEAATEKDVLSTIAGAVGAKLQRTTKGGWELAIDHAEYRRRLTALVVARIRDLQARQSDPIHIADANLCFAALQLLTDAQLETMMDKPDDDLLVTVSPGTELMDRVTARVKAYRTRTDLINDKDPSLYSAVQLAGMLDMERPIQVVIKPLNVSAHLRGKIKGERNAGIDF